MKTVGDTFLDKLGYFDFRRSVTQNYRLKITTEDILFYALHLLTILTTTLEIL